ncbi:unnamed protein product [Adineta ricciae]|uniref:Prolyl 4-hydroxylase alpha subunit Fe(2+) 2OG dioxygenase domain-containing protein n=1 Tax=Adineta ricciae TaxID=249248 RepID=A0A815UAM1_ADIRI|nr:unnamed protein product [Adineta ricciae]
MKCIEERSARFQGNLDLEYLEPLQVVKYTSEQEIPFHKSAHAKSCDILVSDEKSMKSGLRFRPTSENSIFWYNVDEQGKGDVSTYHAGRPPKDGGLKIGLNTWTRSKKITTKKRKDVM